MPSSGPFFSRSPLDFPENDGWMRALIGNGSCPWINGLYPHLYGIKYGLYMDYKPWILSGII